MLQFLDKQFVIVVLKTDCMKIRTTADKAGAKLWVITELIERQPTNSFIGEVPGNCF